MHTCGGRRNRHFRMAWSSKGGKPCQLVPTNRFAGATAGVRAFIAAELAFMGAPAGLLCFGLWLSKVM